PAPRLFCSRPPPTARSARFPYTTLFRSDARRLGGKGGNSERRGNGTGKGTCKQGAERGSHGESLFFAGWLAGTGCDDIRARSLRSEEHTSELQSRENLVCRLPPETKKRP